MEYIVDTIISKHKVSKILATHFAIYKGDEIRYYVAIEKNIRKQAGQRLTRNIAPYSGKLKMLMKVLGKVPYSVLRKAHIGEYVKLEIKSQLESTLNKITTDIIKSDHIYWNILVGSYVEKQKVVFQCFDINKNKAAVYLKVGSKISANEIYNETSYLQKPIYSKNFQNPILCFSAYCDEKHDYAIQVTKEFTGDKVKPELNQEIIDIYYDISGSKPVIIENGIKKVFSHGDFAPWNIKKNSNGYIVFDWEYCGMKFQGFDLIHYIRQVEVNLHDRDNVEAIRYAIKEAKKIDPNIAIMPDEILEQLYIKELYIQFGKIAED